MFRVSSNGLAFLDRVKQELGVQISIISQTEEAELGLWTGQAVAGETRNLVVWDSGGGSFQLTTRDGNGELLSYMAPMGSTTVTASLIERIQGQSFRTVQSPNPARLDHLTQLRTLIMKSLPQPSVAMVAAVARAGGLLTGIGEATSIFNIATLATGTSQFTGEEVWGAIERLAGSSDEALNRFPQPSMVLPKLVLLFTVMAQVAGRRVVYRPSVGVCHGILACEKYWL